MKPKPAFLGPEHGAQFQDESVARSYHARPAYAAPVFPFLADLRPDRAGPVLELGSGTGDLTLGLAQYVDQIDAVEPSSAMLTLARQRCPPALESRIEWHHRAGEDFPFSGPYALIVAAESLHWMDWLQRMSAQAGREFDDEVRRLVSARYAEDQVPIRVETTVVWGRGDT